MRVCKIKITCGFLMAFIMAFAGGCSVIKPVQESVPDENKVEAGFNSDMEYLAAVDLVNTLVQVPRLHPANTEVFHMKKPTPGFGQNIYEVMKIAGYEIQIVDTATVREPQVSYSKRAGTNKTTFQINIEKFKARRAYSVMDSQVRPDSSLYIFGADPDTIKPNDLIFEQYKSASTAPTPESVGKT